MANLEETIKDLPDTPGVYLFKSRKDILYIGKATSIRDRVRSYFSSDLRTTRSLLIEKMVEEADSIDFQETDSVLEALILEANLIKKHQPPYNTQEKDSKSFNHVVITDEDYPRLFTVRATELATVYDPDEFKYVFGPYPRGGALKEALRIIRKIFPYRGKKDPVELKGRKSPLKMQIGLVPDFSEVSKREYSNTIQNLRLFFEGRKGKLIKKLEREMKEAAKEKEFEKAEELKRKIFALQHINDVSLIKEENLREEDPENIQRIEAYDIAHMGGGDSAGVMVVIENGFLKKQDYRRFKIRTAKAGSDTGALKEVLSRRLAHDEWQYPNLIVVDGSTAQINVAESILEEYGFKIPVVSVVKDEKHQPRELKGESRFITTYEKEILLANQEAHRFASSYHQNLRRKRMR
ncbi:MAG: UvrB/UvrC motif-containing protein [Candidatus Paceibacterota bacterium]